jgi:hypothetical protein
VIARIESPGRSHAFSDCCAARHVRFLVGPRLTTDVGEVLTGLCPRTGGRPFAPTGAPRDRAGVAEITDLVNLSRWPETRVIAGGEDSQPGKPLVAPRRTRPVVPEPRSRMPGTRM